MIRRIAWSLLLSVTFGLGCGAGGNDSGSGPSGGSGGSPGTVVGSGGGSPTGATTGSGDSTGSGGSGGSGQGGDGTGGPTLDGGTGGAGGGGGVGYLDGGPVVAPHTVVHDGEKLAQIKQQLAGGNAQISAVLPKLLALANAALTAGPWSVMDKTTTPPSGNKHDYISLARYYWPTAGSANGCPYVHKDGQTNPDCGSNRWDHASRHAAMDAIYNLAMAWYFTGDSRYSDRAELVVRTWFLNPATAMNPNINYGEGVPCLRDGAGTGVLNWTEVIGEALDGIAVLDSGAPGWSTADQMGMRTWLTAFLKWLQTNSLATKEAAASNNHGTWYDTGVSAIMLSLGQTAETKTLVENSKKRIASQIRSDGTQPEELARTNSWGYSNWNLEGFCLLASTAKRVGVDLWGYTSTGGGSIPKAIDYLIRGAEQGKSAWPHQQIAPFEQSWPVSLFHGATDFANDASTRAALPMVPAPAGGDLWALLPICTPAAIQTN